MLFAKTRFARRATFCLLLAGCLSACQNLSPSAVDVPGQAAVAISAAQKIDRLLELMDSRLGVASQVAKAKWNSGAPVDDPGRELQILNEVTKQADTVGGLAPLFVRQFFQNQFDAGKILQKNLLAGWRRTVAPGYKFGDAPDLGRDVRPILDRLTPQLIAALSDVQPLLQQPGMRRYMTMQAGALIRGDVDGAVRHQALKALLAE